MSFRFTEEEKMEMEKEQEEWRKRQPQKPSIQSHEISLHHAGGCRDEQDHPVSENFAMKAFLRRYRLKMR
jgi:hypothetical protein